jgi:prepilin-type N-terminal cleavage/methylation domain-containing protein
MIPMQTFGPQRAKGFSLVELMVALVAGLIVVGAVLAFTVSSVRANSEYIKSTRLQQELRNSSDYITSELKRAGYDEAAMDYVANPTSTAVSKFAPLLIDTTAGANCVIYGYDRQPGTPGRIDLDQGEIRAIRRATATINGHTLGVIEVAESKTGVTPACNGAQPDYSLYPVTCNTSSSWCPLSDPRSVDIQTFTVNTTPDTANLTTNGVRTIPGASGFNALQQRELQVTVGGSLSSDVAVTRTMRANIKVRADCLRPLVTTACNAAPTP